MTNFTVAIPNDLLSETKVIAAKTNTSVNAIIRMLLEGFIENKNAIMSGNSEILLKYSLGKISTKEAMKQLHVPNKENLDFMVVQSGFPIPRILEKIELNMQNKFSDMLDRNIL